MLVPALVIQLNEPDVTFCKASGEQAVVGVFADLSGLGSIHVEHRLWLAVDVNQFGYAHLHPVGKFILSDPVFDLRIVCLPEFQLVQLAQRMGLQLNSHGFCATDPLDVVATSRPGVYVCGAAQGPKDIPETVIQGSAAAAGAMSPASSMLRTATEASVVSGL